MPRPIAAATLAVLLLSAVVRAAAAQSFFALAGGVLDQGNTAPRSVGPIPVSGGAGASGTASAFVDLGRLSGRTTAQNPISGLFTPQVDAEAEVLLDAFDVSCPTCPPEGIQVPVVFHTELTGRLAISGAHPYAASVRLTLQTIDMAGFLEGTMVLGPEGLASSGFLAGAPAEMNHYPVDFALTLALAPDPADVLLLSLESSAGGTAFGTEVNTAESDFAEGWTIPHSGEVFSGLPAGVTVNIPSLNVVNNHWAGITAVDSGNPAGRLALLARTNPVRGRARLALALPAAGPARVEVFDVSGARVATLLDGWQPAGARDLEWNASASPAGVYFARVTAAGRSAHTRLAVVR